MYLQHGQKKLWSGLLSDWLDWIAEKEKKNNEYCIRNYYKQNPATGLLQSLLQKDRRSILQAQPRPNCFQAFRQKKVPKKSSHKARCVHCPRIGGGNDASINLLLPSSSFSIWWSHTTTSGAYHSYIDKNTKLKLHRETGLNLIVT
jgi:hypothetical protein